MRQLIVDFQAVNWDEFSEVAEMPWHELITMVHNVALPVEDETEPWEEEPDNRLSAWTLVRDNIYGGTSEFIAFVEMMWLRLDMRLTIRVWRRPEALFSDEENDDEVDGNAYEEELQLSETIRNHDRTAAKKCRIIDVTADVLHTGTLDGVDAHYQLLATGAFENLKTLKIN